MFIAEILFPPFNFQLSTFLIILKDSFAIFFFCFFFWWGVFCLLQGHLDMCNCLLRPLIWWVLTPGSIIYPDNDILPLFSTTRAHLSNPNCIPLLSLSILHDCTKESNLISNKFWDKITSAYVNLNNGSVYSAVTIVTEKLGVKSSRKEQKESWWKIGFQEQCRPLKEKMPLK